MNSGDLISDLRQLMTDDDVELTITPTHPDLDVIEFQASISVWPHVKHAIGRSGSINRAVSFAMKLWKDGKYGVWDEEDEADGGVSAAIGRR